MIFKRLKTSSLQTEMKEGPRQPSSLTPSLQPWILECSLYLTYILMPSPCERFSLHQKRLSASTKSFGGGLL